MFFLGLAIGVIVGAVVMYAWVYIGISAYVEMRKR